MMTRTKLCKLINWLSILLVLLIMAVPVMELAANAATALNLGVAGLNASYDLSIGKLVLGKGSASCEKASENAISASASGYKSALAGSVSSSVTIYLKNTGYDSALLTFQYTKTGNGSVEVSSNATQQSDGSWKADLAKDGQVTIKITSEKNSNATNLSVTEINLVEKATKTTVFEPADSNKGSYTVDGTAVTATTTKSQDASIAYTLVATPKSGYKFAGWKIVGQNSYLAGPSSLTFAYRAAADLTITAEFVPVDTLLFGVEAAQFTLLKDADDYAKSLGGAQINLLSSGILPAGNYLISQGNTLLIPYNNNNTCITIDNISTTGHAGHALDPGTTKMFNKKEITLVNTYAFRTMTLASGAHIQVEGCISVSSQHTSGGSPGLCGAPVGPYGHIEMASGSSITVKDGGRLYAWGYVTGDGTVDILNGGTVYEMFQIMDFRGGTATTGMVNNEQKVLPFSQYYVQNVEAEMNLYYGAKEIVFGNVYMGNKTNPMPVEFIGSEAAMFVLGEGTWVTKKYDAQRDRLILSANGETPDSTVTLGSLTVTFTLIIPYPVNTAKYVLPLNNNMTININSGTMEVTSDIAALPGCELYIANGATVHVAENASMFAYSSADWGGYCSSVNWKFIPVPYSPSRTYQRTEADLKDVIVDINGYLFVEGYVYTTQGNAGKQSYAAIISSQGTGVVEFLNAGGFATETYQCMHEDNYVKIPVYNAWLKNADGSFTKTGEILANNAYASDYGDGGAFFYNNGKWAMVTKVSYDPNGGTGNMDPDEIHNWDIFEPSRMDEEGNLVGDADGDGYLLSKIPYDVTIAANGFSRPGYTFVGWNTKADGSGTNYAPGEQISVTSDMTLYAQWEVNSYTITWVVDGATYETMTQFFGTNLTPPVAPSKLGYTFKGWFTATEGGTQVDANTVFQTDADTTYYAQWTRNSYTVTWIVDGVENKVTYEYGATIVKPADPTKTGHTFTGWNGEIPATMPAENLTFTATWSVNSYTVTFTINGEIFETRTFAYGAAVNAPAYSAPEGYSFSGWSVPMTMPADNITLDASLTINSYTVTWIVDGVENKVTYEYGATIVKPADPTKTGYTFAGWDVEIPATMPAEDLTFTATWSVNSYTVTWIVDGVEEEVTYEYGATIVKPADPTKTGYTFAGWDVEIPATMPAENLTITATWSVNSYTITFQAGFVGLNGIEETYSYTLPYGSAIPDVVFNREGYHLLGWKDAEGNAIEIPATVPAENMVVVADWEINTYTITVSIVAPGADPVHYLYYVTHGGTLTATSADWNLDTCYAFRSVESLVKFSFDGVTLTIQNVTEDIAVTVNAAQCHTVGNVVVENYIAPTCTEEGSYDLVVYCSECSAVIKSVHYTIDATGHCYGTVSYNWSADFATCTATRTCAHCSEVETANATATTVTTDASCTEDGKTVYTADFDESWAETQTKEVVIEATGHNYTAVVTAPTCTTAGYTTYTCACGHSYKDNVVEATGHSYTSSVTKEASCTEAGEMTYTCTCGHSYTEEIPMIAHSYTAVVTAPTCTTDGYTTYTCTCGHSYKDDVVEASGHNYTAVVTAPTCTTAGYTTYTCACGRSYKDDVVEATGHNYTAVVTAPTCTTDGYTTYTCACGHSYVGNYVAANGHYDAMDDNDHICDNCDYVCGDHMYVDGNCNCGDVLTFTVTWIIDGVETTETYTYGQIPTAPTAEKVADENYTYSFMGWDKTINPVTQDTTYTAIFAKTGWYTDENGTTYLIKDQMNYFGEWITIENDQYYFQTNGYIAKDIYNIRSVLYVFDKETGVFLNDYTGVYTTNADKTYYVENGIVNREAGLVRVIENGYAHYYYFCYNADKCTKSGCPCDGSAVKGGVHWVADNNGLLVQWDYTFGADGVIVHDAAYATYADPHHEVVTYGNLKYYTIDGIKVHKGLFIGDGKLLGKEGAYYYARSSGVLTTNRVYYVTDTNGLLPADSYLFGEDGAIIMEPTFYTTSGKIYYYCNGVLTYAGLIEHEGNYYYVRSNGELVMNRTYWISKTNGWLPEGSYTFDATGKLITGDVEEETTDNAIVKVGGVLYYYENGVPCYKGLFYYAGDETYAAGYYYARTNGKLATGTYWITKTNDLMAEKAYTFDANGRMITD